MGSNVVKLAYIINNFVTLQVVIMEVRDYYPIKCSHKLCKDG